MGSKDNALVVQKPQLLQTANITDIKKWYNDFVKISKDILKDGLDFGTVPGVEKPALFKPGAEKLRFFYGLQAKTEKTDFDIDAEQNWIDYTYKTTILSPDGTKILSECEGNCNSFESKFRFLWVKEDDVPEGLEKSKLKKRVSSVSEFAFAIDKAETGGQYGKPAEYWEKWKTAIKEGRAKKIMRKSRTGKELDAWEMGGTSYRIPNEDVLGLKNTIMKMAQKRSFVGAVLMATGASEFFTQDVEEMDIPVDETEIVATPEPAKPASVKQVKKTTPVKKEEPVEGEVVDEGEQQPGPATDADERTRQAKLKWILSLEKAGKLPTDNYGGMTLEQLTTVMDNYRKGIGK